MIFIWSPDWIKSLLEVKSSTRDSSNRWVSWHAAWPQSLYQRRTEMSTKHRPLWLRKLLQEEGPWTCTFYSLGQGSLPKMFSSALPVSHPCDLSRSGLNYQQVFKAFHSKAAMYVSTLIPSFPTHNPLAPHKPRYFYMVTPCPLDTPYSPSLLNLLSLPRVASLLLSIYFKLSQSLKSTQASHCPRHFCVCGDSSFSEHR